MKCKLLRMTVSHNLDQLIQSPTRITSNSSTLIDLLFCNNVQRIVDHGVIPLTLSDNSMIFCVMKSGMKKAPGRIVERRAFKYYSKDNFIRDLKDVNWKLIQEENNIDSAVSKWDILFTNVADQHAPLKKSRISGLHTPWLTSELIQLMHKRDYSHRKALKTNFHQHWTSYKRIKNIVNKEIKKSKSTYYSKLIEDNKSNPTSLWRTINDITSRNVRSTITSIEADSGEMFCDHKSIAEVLNHYFSTIGSKLANKLKSMSLYAPLGLNFLKAKSLFNSKPIDECFVLNKLKHLKYPTKPREQTKLVPAY